MDLGSGTVLMDPLDQVDDGGDNEGHGAGVVS